MNAKESYKKKVQAQLDEWAAEIDRLRARADKDQADAQLRYYSQIGELRAMQAAAGQKLDQLKAAGDTAWEDLRGGIERARDSLGAAVKAAASRFT